QFAPHLNPVTAANANDLFASIPFWPGTTFSHLDRRTRTKGRTAERLFVMNQGVSTSGADAGFANYSSCMILGLLAEIQQILTDSGNTVLGKKVARLPVAQPSLTWGAIWKELFAPLSSDARK